MATNKQTASQQTNDLGNPQFREKAEHFIYFKS